MKLFLFLKMIKDSSFISFKHKMVYSGPISRVMVNIERVFYIKNIIFRIICSRQRCGFFNRDEFSGGINFLLVELIKFFDNFIE
jgi:hypothetical protein